MLSFWRVGDGGEPAAFATFLRDDVERRLVGSAWDAPQSAAAVAEAFLEVHLAPQEPTLRS